MTGELTLAQTTGGACTTNSFTTTVVDMTSGNYGGYGGGSWTIGTGGWYDSWGVWHPNYPSYPAVWPTVIYQTWPVATPLSDKDKDDIAERVIQKMAKLGAVEQRQTERRASERRTAASERRTTTRKRAPRSTPAN